MKSKIMFAPFVPFQESIAGLLQAEKAEFCKYGCMGGYASSEDSQ
jgi:hypothetical protein